MAIKISELTAVTNIAGTEEIPVVQSATTKKATAVQLKGYRAFVAIVWYDQINAELNFTILQNDGFNINTNRSSAGLYTLEDISGPFLEEKTFLSIQQSNNNNGGGDYNYIVNGIFRENDEVIKIFCVDFDFSGNATHYTDIYYRQSFEIRVYP